MMQFRKKSRLSRMKRGVAVSAELLDGDARADGWLYRPLFVTLTYRPGEAWSPSHIRAYLNGTRMNVERQGGRLRYVWVMELTKSGVPHYHVMFWIRASLRLPTPDRSGLWPYGMSKVERARRPVGYLIKYASKGDAETPFPKGARIFGAGGLTLAQRATKRWRLLPLYVRVAFNDGDSVRRAKGGGWLNLNSGEWLPAPSLVFKDGAITVEARNDQDRSN